MLDLTTSFVHNSLQKKTGTSKSQSFGNWVWMYIFFAVLLILSYSCELLFQKSFTELCFPRIVCPVFLRASTILDVIKIAGFSNVLIGWNYKSINRQMLGKSFSELIQFKFPFYNECSIAHIFATICCIISASAGTSESATIALVAVLYGFSYQTAVLYQIVLRDGNCETIAEEYWKAEIRNESSIKNNLIQLANTMPPPNNPHLTAHLNCFTLAFSQYCNCEVTGELIREVACIWSILLNSTNLWDSFEIIASVVNHSLDELPDTILEDQKVKNAKILLAGYLVYLIPCEIQEYNETPWVSSREDALRKDSLDYAHIAAKLAMLIAYLRNTNLNLPENLIDSLITNYRVIAWVLFQRGNISMLSEILSLEPSSWDYGMVHAVAYGIACPTTNEQKNQLNCEVQQARILCYPENVEIIQYSILQME